MFAIKPLDQTGVSRDGFFDGAVNFISPILLGLIILFSLVQVVEAVGKSAKRPLLRERTFGLVGFGLLTLIFVRLPWPFVGGTLAAQFWNLVLVLASETGTGVSRAGALTRRCTGRPLPFVSASSVGGAVRCRQ